MRRPKTLSNPHICAFTSDASTDAALEAYRAIVSRGGVIYISKSELIRSAIKLAAQHVTAGAESPPW